MRGDSITIDSIREETPGLYDMWERIAKKNYKTINDPGIPEKDFVRYGILFLYAQSMALDDQNPRKPSRPKVFETAHL